jgi:uncharacterized membrane protein YbhN (UPF0104 family)
LSGPVSPEGVQLFAAGRDDPRARRTIDVIRAVGSFILLGVASVLSVVAHDLDTRFSGFLTGFPGFLHFLWILGFWGAVIWSVALLVITAYRRRFALVGEVLLACVLAVGLAALIAELAGKSPAHVFTQLADVNGPPVFPPGAMAISSAVIATMAPRLTLPFRRFGRVLLAAQLVGCLFLGAALASGAIAAIAIGLIAGTSLHLVFGSPGGLPSVSRVRGALNQLDVVLDDLRVIAVGSDGVSVLLGKDASGAVLVKVYGRDAWDGELAADIWRRVWYRGNTRRFRLSRLEYAEHEGFITLLARQAGARVPDVVTAGVADNGDALIAIRPIGTELSADGTDGETLRADQLATLWHDLDVMHRAGIVHRRIDLDRVAREGDTASFSDLSSAGVQWLVDDRLKDAAQLVALGIVTCGEDASIAQTRAALGDDDTKNVLPYLQEAAMPPLVRGRLRADHRRLDAVRKHAADALGTKEPDLVKVQRVTWRSMLNLVLLAVAAYTLIGLLAGIDFHSFFKALGNAHWWWLGAALLIGQSPRVANAVSAIGSLDQPLPLGPATQLQFATCYVNLAVPSSAGRIAITTRFYQRFGVPTAKAVSAGLINSLFEFVVQLTLFFSVFFISDTNLGFSVDQSQLKGIATTAIFVVGAIILAVAIGFAIPKLRARMMVTVGQVREALHVLRSPTNLLELFGGNLFSQVLFAVTLGACVRAFGYSVPLSKLILINTAVTLFAGLLPVPGGVGVSEAGISLGLTRAGVPSAIAFAIALSYRFCVYYLPPLWGYLSFRWLNRRQYL